MRIVYLVDFFRTVLAGTEKQLGHLLKRLPEQGHTISLISFQDSPFLSHEAGTLFSGVAIRTLGASSDISKSPQSLLPLWKHLRLFRPDIVHTFFPTSNSIGAILARLSGVRTVITSRRDMGFNLSLTDLGMLRFANPVIAGIIANSQAVRAKAARMEGFHAERIHVVCNGIDASLFLQKPDNALPAHPVVGIVANLNRPVKRVDVFIRAAARVHRDFPAARFWVVGDGPLKPQLEALATECNLGQAIAFLGRRPDVKQLLQEFSVGVICSDSEGLSNAIMEYMAAGVPTLATDAGGNPELIRHGATGYLVAPSDDAALSYAMGTLLADPEKAAEMGTKAWLKASREYSVARMVGQTICIYEACLVGKKASRLSLE